MQFPSSSFDAPSVDRIANSRFRGGGVEFESVTQRIAPRFDIGGTRRLPKFAQSTSLFHTSIPHQQQLVGVKVQFGQLVRDQHRRQTMAA
jgi:hypothetical protein